MTTKICTKCMEHKPLKRFAKRGANDQRLRSHCMDCKNAYMLAYKRGELFKTDDIPAKPIDHKNVVRMARDNLWERPVYKAEPWGR